ncbi:helix-hairpin-helix domain-containing protein [Alkalibacterium sp. f15]|uniref:helix-hairpin-helix domain-containing protein n=1 Tax=Alkalibacterium sp. f15 TaxID=3414029 RepID=UPI003BF85817
MDNLSKMNKSKIAIWSLGILCAISVVIFILSVNHTDENAEDRNTVTLDTLLTENSISDAEKEVEGTNERIDKERDLSVVVDVKGAVNNPGVFSLDANQRVIDAIDAANGLAEKADTKHINFAQLLEDEMYIYIPVEGEEMVGIEISLEGGHAKDAKININDANEQTLSQLNGIGPSKANDIIEYREKNGPFESIDEIIKVSGIGEKTYEKISEYIEAK